MNPRIPKLLALLTILVLTVPLFLVPSAAVPEVQAGVGVVKTASDVAAAKIHPQLKAALAAAALTDDIDLLVYAKPGTDLSRYMTRLVVRPYVLNGTQAYYGRAKVAQVGKIASLSEVAAVKEMKNTADLPILPEGSPPRLNTDLEALKARLAALKAGARNPTVTRPVAGGASVADWFDVLDVHKSKAAWDLGYTGEGVTVMVNDSGIDFSHPDLQGTMARVTDPESPYYGWPMMFDSYSMLNLAYDAYVGTDYIMSGEGLGSIPPWYVYTGFTREGSELVDNGDGTLSATFAPIGSTDPDGHVYTFKATSKSGVYHFGSHPDTLLAELLGERAAVLVVDENTAGVYDTVYVDLDGDYDFTNEKAAVKGDEYSYNDLDGDGYPDLSGGIIYYIADGVHPIPATDWWWGIPVDLFGPGNLVAFMINDPLGPGGDHGQLCASAVAGQGVIDGGAPVYKPAGDGTPGTGMVMGGGKDVKLTANGDFYASVDDIEGFIFAALGYDGEPGTADDAQIINNSWGSSAVVNDGWDYSSRSMDAVMRFINPTLSNMDSTGNGAAGYGTLTSPGAPLSVGVGASTLYDSDNVFDSLTSRDQFQFNNVQSWSNRGPAATGENGVSVVANGAWGAGDTALNNALDGWNAWYSWGGTSKSAPTAAGNLALVYQAFKEKNGRWPTNQEARALLMSGADTTYNDGLVEGAGSVNALRSVKIAAGMEGVYVRPDNVSFGDYRGTRYTAFANIMHPGQTSTVNLTVYNPGAADVTVKISDDRLVRVGQTEWEFTSLDRSKESPYQHRKPDYLWNITGKIPAGTDLVEAKIALPMGEFDPEGDNRVNSSWRVLLYDWTDVNGDGVLWNDLNGDGAVTCPVKSGQPNYADPSCEIQKGEYMRYGYGYNSGTSNQVRAKQPLDTMHDGIFLGLLHRDRSATVPVTHLKIQLNFYKRADWPWLTTDETLTVPAGGSATFKATMTVPELANMGLYEGAIRVFDGVNVTNVPAVVNVAAFSTDFLFGGPPEGKTPYDNGEVYGYFDWNWRAESGDWRFYFVDVPDSTPMGTNLLVDTRWTGPNSDIDTLIMGPTEDCFSNGVGCESPFSIFPGLPPVYGPYSLAPKGGSSRLNPRAGVWLQNTSTGGPREIVAAEATPGLNLVALHNVRFDGGQIEERFQGQVGTIMADPYAVDLFVGSATSGSFPMTIQSSLPLVGLKADAFGLGVPQTTAGLPQIQDDPDDPSTASYKFPIAVQHAAKLEVSTTATAGDLDLFLLYDANADGNFDFNTEVIGSSTTPTADEFVRVTMPKDGNYLAAVQGWNAANTTFDFTVNAVQGYDMTITGLANGPFQPNVPINFTVNWSKTIPAGQAAEGLILAGPPGAPAAVQIPVRLHNIVTGSKTETFTPTGDTFVAKNFPNTNYGGYADLYVDYFDWDRPLVQFNTSSLNPIYPLQSAKLRLYMTGYGGTGKTHDLSAHEVTTAWNESTATWNVPWTTPGGDVVLTPVGTTQISKDDVGKWVEVDVTSLVAKWIANPAANHGVLLRATNGLGYAVFRFGSSEHWFTDKVPQLVVTYGVP